MQNILLADDHAIIRGGLKVLIAGYIAHSVIDEASDGNDAFEKIKIKDYQLIILDVNMPGTDSFGLVSNIIALKPHANILMFSMNAEKIYAKKYIQTGAKGFLSKGSSEDEIKNAINLVIRGKRYLSSSLVSLLTDDALGKSSANPFDDLSIRETEIATHLINGKTSSEISSFLNLQPSTIGTFKSRIFEKLNCKNLLQMIELQKLHNISSL